MNGQIEEAINTKTGWTDPFSLRLRLFRRFIFRTWKSLYTAKAKKLVRQICYEVPSQTSALTPVIVLSTFSSLEDFLVLSYLFQDKELTFLSPKNLPKNRLINRLQSMNHVLEFDPQKIGFRFFRQLLRILKDFNRSIVISEDAANIYVKDININQGVVAKLAVKGNVPVVPVVINWNGPRESAEKGIKRGCVVYIGKKLYVSPRTPEFKDIFFRRRGQRKFEQLSKDEFEEIGKRISSKLKSLPTSYGSNLS